MKEQLSKPKRVIIEITDRCNFNCIHCFANKRDKSVSPLKWKSFFEKVENENIDSVTITGGEPLLYEGLFSTIGLKRKRIKFTIDTNGSLIDENNIGLIKKYFKLVRVSYYGLGKSWKTNSRSKTYTTEHFLKMLELCQNNGVKVQVKIPMFANNLKKLDKIMESLMQFNLYEIVLIPIIPISRAKSLKNLPSGDEIKNAYKKYRKLLGKKMRLFRWAEGKHFLIRSNGDTYLHPFMNESQHFLGNAFNCSISQMWKNVPMSCKKANEKLTTNLDNL